MSRRYWIAAIALGLVWFLVALPTLSTATTHAEDSVENGAKHQLSSPAYRNEKAAKPRWLHWPSHLVAAEDTLAQWIMALFTIAAALISYRAVVLVSRTLKANTDAVAEAREGNRIAQETALRQLRAYVQIGDVRIENFRVGEDPVLICTGRNFGQTPAFRYSHISSWRLVDDAETARLRFVNVETAGPAVDLPTNATTTQATQLPTLAEDVFEGIMSGKRQFVTFGLVRYRDIFGVRRRVIFRHVLIPERSGDGVAWFNICNRNNRST